MSTMPLLVPFHDWAKCASVLDDGLLQETRDNSLVALESLLGLREDEDPAIDMWVEHESALVIYGTQMCLELWMARRISDSVQFSLKHLSDEYLDFSFVSPPWRDDKDLMRSHRSWLIRRSKRYRKTFPGTPDDIPTKST